MGFPRQEYWSGLPFPPPGDLSDPGMDPGSPALQAESLPIEPQGKPYSLPQTLTASLLVSCSAEMTRDGPLHYTEHNSWPIYIIDTKITLWTITAIFLDANEETLGFSQVTSIPNLIVSDSKPVALSSTEKVCFGEP